MCWAQIIGAGVGAGQSGLQGEQGAAVMNSNADMLDLKAEDAMTRGGVQEDIQRDKTAQMLGFQRAAMGASGIQVDSGSGGKVLEQTAGMGELDALNIRTNALREAWGFKSEADSQRAQADNAMGMMDFLAPGGRDFQKKLQINTLFTAGTGLELLGNMKAKKESFDSKRTPWK